MASTLSKNDYLERAHEQLAKIRQEARHDPEAFAKAKEHLEALERLELSDESWLKHQTAFEKQLVEISD
ncbi:MAG: hypothetical protein KC422_23505 [Trueperaceae bacterium]|nr:hypothetical protein [Trueperaceae bacterium]